MSDIRYEKHGKVHLIVIDCADKMNSLDFAANDRLVDAWREFDRDDEAQVAVITGTGDQAFCAGANLKTYTMAFARTPAPEFRSRFTNGPDFGGITRNLESRSFHDFGVAEGLQEGTAAFKERREADFKGR